jgi:hypothetical protein
MSVFACRVGFGFLVVSRKVGVRFFKKNPRFLVSITDPPILNML